MLRSLWAAVWNGTRWGPVEQVLAGGVFDWHPDLASSVRGSVGVAQFVVPGTSPREAAKLLVARRAVRGSVGSWTLERLDAVGIPEVADLQPLPGGGWLLLYLDADPHPGTRGVRLFTRRYHARQGWGTPRRVTGARDDVQAARLIALPNGGWDAVWRARAPDGREVLRVATSTGVDTAWRSRGELALPASIVGLQAVRLGQRRHVIARVEDGSESLLDASWSDTQPLHLTPLRFGRAGSLPAVQRIDGQHARLFWGMAPTAQPSGLPMTVWRDLRATC